MEFDISLSYNTLMHSQDCTASDLVPSAYLALAKRGIHIVTPNKKFGAGPLQRFIDLQDVCRITGSRFMFEVKIFLYP